MRGKTWSVDDHFFSDEKHATILILFLVIFSYSFMLRRLTKLPHNSDVLPRALRHNLRLAFGHGLCIHQIGTHTESEGSSLQELLRGRQRDPTGWNQIDLRKRP